MKCKCGAWASVKETREDRYGRTRRRYECASLHRFTTYEISDTLMRTLSKDRLEDSLRVREVQGAYLARDTKIIEAVEVQGRSQTEVAAEHGISRSRVHLIVKRHRAGLDPILLGSQSRLKYRGVVLTAEGPDEKQGQENLEG